MSSGAPAADLRADLVLEGGGVKGIALASAAATLARHGYAFPRIAGTSAGAIVGAVLAALQSAGEPLERAEDVARSLRYDKVRDRGVVGRALGPLGWIVDGFSLALEGGIYEGDYLHDWLRGVLDDLGVRTFGDLREDDPGSALSTEHAYRLVVLASDLSRQRLAHLPWDHAGYGLDPDEMVVADAVRASASIPFLFEPVPMRGAHGVSTLVDGALLSNYPIGVFDRDDGRPPRWPTLGLRVSTAIGGDRPVQPVEGPISLALALVETTLEAYRARHLHDESDLARSIFIDTTGVESTDFDITDEQQDQLVEAGERAVERFLEGWDFTGWRRAREVG